MKWPLSRYMEGIYTTIHLHYITSHRIGRYFHFKTIRSHHINSRGKQPVTRKERTKNKVTRTEIRTIIGELCEEENRFGICLTLRHACVQYKCRPMCLLCKHAWIHA